MKTEFFSTLTGRFTASDLPEPFRPERSTQGRLQIGCLSSEGISSYEISHSLKQNFGREDIYPIAPKHLTPEILSRLDLLVLPGIDDESNHYPKILDGKIDILKDAIENHGLVLLTFCAASYFMFSRIKYLPRNGVPKERNGADLIKGEAVHAFSHVTRKTLNGSPWNDFVMAEVKSEDPPHSLRALNINGPTMMVDRQKDPLVQTFMSYVAINGDAIIVKPMKRGGIIASGIHPEISPIHKNLPEDFAKYENDRHIIWFGIKKKIMELVRNARSTSVTEPSYG